MSTHIEAFVSISKFGRIFFVEFCFLAEQDRQIWARLAYSSTRNILKLIKGLVCNGGWAIEGFVANSIAPPQPSVSCAYKIYITMSCLL
jgi:hypothetical protein